MKKFIFVLLVLSLNNGYCQDTLSYRLFTELVEKVQNDKSLRGTFMYKGYQAQIGEYTELKTAIGKYIEVSWKPSSGGGIPPYQAIYHNTMGYMTRSLFNIYAKSYTKEDKEGDHLYCRSNWCITLITTGKTPYFMRYQRLNSELKEIK